MVDRAKCVECGEITPVKKDGKLWKHYDANNDPCSSLEGTSVEAMDVVFAQKGQSLESQRVKKAEKCENCPENAENCSISGENCQKSTEKAKKDQNFVSEAEKVENSEKSQNLFEKAEKFVFKAENSPKSRNLAEKVENSEKSAENHENFENLPKSVKKVENSSKFAEKVENSPKSAQNPVFRLTIPVKAPCPYLEDTKWHQANKDLAEKKAQKEGKTPSGRATFEESRPSDDGRTLNLLYVVPIN